jgi:hypothetical protein
MAPVEAECVGSPYHAGGGVCGWGTGNASTQSGEISSAEAERDRELSARYC